MFEFWKTEFLIYICIQSKCSRMLNSQQLLSIWMGFSFKKFTWKALFLLLLAIFYALLSLENSQYQKENRMRSLERPNPGSFWLGSLNEGSKAKQLQDECSLFWLLKQILLWWQRSRWMKYVNKIALISSQKDVLLIENARI